MLGALLSLASPALAQVPTPDAHFGFRLGSDRRLATADAIERYFALVAAQSDRVMIVDLGPTTEGQPHDRRRHQRTREHPEPRRASARPTCAWPIRALLDREEARRLASTQKVIVAIGASIHAIRGRRHAGRRRAALLAGYGHRPGHAATVLQNVVARADPVAQSRRASPGHRLVRAHEGHAVRRRADAVALSQVRRARHQPRRVHDEPRGEPQPRAVLLQRRGIRRCS